MSKLCAELEAQIRLLKLPKPEREYRFHEKRRWRFDFAWIDKKFAVEVDGGLYIMGRHNRGKGYENDLEKYHEAMALGWNIYRCGAKLIKSGQAVNLIEKVIREQ